MKVRVAAVNTMIDEGPDRNKINLERAYNYLSEAVSKGAEIVCFPETYPGPWREPFDGFSPHAAMADMAKEKNVYLIYGLAERINPESADAHYITECFVGPDGKLIGKYHRCCPPGPWIYKGGDFWDVNYTGGNSLPVFDTDLGRIGILVCSEVYMPELSRCMAIQGAEITFLPAGIKKGSQNELFDTWKVLIQARAFENLMYTVTAQNLRKEDDPGMAMICAPEYLAAFSDKEGVVVETCDLDRVKQLREGTDKYVSDDCYRTKAGVIREWRRPEVYGEILRGKLK